MNRLLGLITILFLSVPTWALCADDVITVQDRGNSGVNIGWYLESVSTPQFVAAFEDEQFQWSEDGLGNPSITRWVAVPSGYDIKTHISHRASYSVESSQYNNPAASRELVNVDGLQLSPSEVVSVGRIEHLRGIRMAPVTIYPIQLNEQNSAVIENRNLDVSLSFVPTADPNSTLQAFNDHPNSSTVKMIDRLLLNPPRRDPGEPQVEYFDHILILHQDDNLFMNNNYRWVDSLATWKTQIGYLVTVEAVDTDTDPREIRELIRDYYESEFPISGVIIIGGEAENARIYFPTCPLSDQIVGDHFYSQMVRRDPQVISDITVSRFQAHSDAELRAVIMRSIWYERDPYRENEDDDWFTRGIYTAENIVAPGGQFVPSMMHLGRWVQSRLLQMGFTHVDTFWQDNAALLTRSVLEDGVSIAISRGWLEGCLRGRGNEPVDTGRRNPFAMNITCLSFEKLDIWWRSSDYIPNNLDALIGPVAGMGFIELTHTKTNTSLVGGIIRAMCYFDLNQPGLIQNFGKLQLASDYRHDQAELVNIVEILASYRLLGDPTVNSWTGRPVELTVDHPENISVDETGLTVYVESEDGPIPDATVCIWQPDGDVHLVTFPGDDGVARFTFDEGVLEEGDMSLTITRANTFPYIDTIDVEGEGISLDAIDYSFDETTLFGEQIDNEDGLFGNGYTIPTSLTLINNTDNDVNDIVVSLTTEDELVSFEPNQIDLENLTANDDGVVEFDLVIDRSSKFGRVVRVDVELSSGNSTWNHAFKFTTSGPLLSYRELQIQGGQFARGNNLLFEIDVQNDGDLPSPRMTGTLISMEPDYVTVRENANSAIYPVIESEDLEGPSGGRIQISIDDRALPGNYPFRLELSAVDEDDSFEDVVYIEDQSIEWREVDPTGPDAYGYLCFDSGDDRNWSKAPNYQWREINPAKPDFDFDGERIEVEVLQGDPDSSVVVDLPFTFQYYGEEFDEIVVCANGWIAFGADQSMFVDFRNWQIPGNQGPDAMVCAFWQDLDNLEAGDRGIFVHHIEEEGVFIIEWSEWGIYRGGTDDLLEFQIILFDVDSWPTETNDGDIKIQYKHVVARGGDSTDNQFFTVGIKNLDGSDGLEYSYWNRYSAGAAELENEMAILFTTEVELRVGSIYGRVATIEDDSPLEGANVLAMPAGLEAVTDVDGNYRIDDVPVGTSVLEVRLAGYNVFRQGDNVIEEGGEIELNVAMTHPVIQAEADTIHESVHLYEEGQREFSVGNTGSGELLFELSTRYENGDPIVYDQQQGGIPITQVTGDGGIRGCQLAWGKLYISGGNHNRDSTITDTSLTNYIYVLEQDGDGYRRFEQPSRTTHGFWDLAWDSKNDVMYGGEERNDESSWLVAFNRGGVELDRIVVGVHRDDLFRPRALAFCPDSGTVFMADNDSHIYEIIVSGERRGEITIHYYSLPGENIDIRGMAWNELDSETPLYMMDLGDENMRLIRYNPWTRKMRIVGAVGQDGDFVRGLTFGFDWNEGYHSMAAVGGHDVFRNSGIRIFEVGPDSRFIEYDAGPYTVQPQNQQTIELLFDASKYHEPDRTYRAGLQILHNSAEDPIVIPLQITVDNPISVGEAEELLPLKFGLDHAYPNPFNSTTRIGFTLAEPGRAQLTVYDIAGREVIQLFDEVYESGKHSVALNGADFAAGVYFYRLKSGGKSITHRMVLLK